MIKIAQRTIRDILRKTDLPDCAYLKKVSGLGQSASFIVYPQGEEEGPGAVLKVLPAVFRPQRFKFLAWVYCNLKPKFGLPAPSLLAADFTPQPYFLFEFIWGSGRQHGHLKKNHIHQAGSVLARIHGLNKYQMFGRAGLGVRPSFYAKIRRLRLILPRRIKLDHLKLARVQKSRLLAELGVLWQQREALRGASFVNPVFCHMDYHPNNLLFSDDGQDKLAAVFDFDRAAPANFNYDLGIALGHFAAEAESLETREVFEAFLSGYSEKAGGNVSLNKDLKRLLKLRLLEEISWFLTKPSNQEGKAYFEFKFKRYWGVLESVT